MALPAGLGVRHRDAARGPSGCAALTPLTLFLTFDLIVFRRLHAADRLGLGCPDWPGCYGRPARAARTATSQPPSAMPTGPVTLDGKAWIEMIHRYLATAVGVLLIVITVLLAAGQRRGQPPSRPGGRRPRWPGCAIQGLFGALSP